MASERIAVAVAESAISGLLSGAVSRSRGPCGGSTSPSPATISFTKQYSKQLQFLE